MLLFFLPFLSPLSSLQGQAGAELLLLNLDLELYWAWAGVPKLSLLQTGRKAPAGESQRAKKLLRTPWGHVLVETAACAWEGPDSESRAQLNGKIVCVCPPPPVDLLGTPVSQICHLGGLEHRRRELYCMGSNLSSATFRLCGLGQGTSAQRPHCLGFHICKMGIMILPVCSGWLVVD